MSLLNKLFGSSKDEKETPKFWNYIESEEDLQKALEQSYHEKVVIFKHSTRCFISQTVLKNFEKEVENSGKKATYYFLDLIEYRSLSSKIADDLDVTHQSPQLIVVENGKAVNNASHQSISTALI